MVTCCPQGVSSAMHTVMTKVHLCLGEGAKKLEVGVFAL
jgi:hypothetical protein